MRPAAHDRPDAVALQRLLAVEPVLRGVTQAGPALGLEPLELLHAGPPLRDPTRPPEVIMSSAVMACLHEGWASDAPTAEAMVRSGRVRLSPAQHRRCVVPLAFVVSQGTPLFEVANAAGPGFSSSADGSHHIETGPAPVFSPVSAVRGADLRMGIRDAGLIARLVDRDVRVAPLWEHALATIGPIPLLPVAAHALGAGDDLHSRTTAATQQLADWLRSHAKRDDLAADLDATPLFFLTIWMAASALILRAAEGGDLPSLVTRAGGNGEHFAIALAGSPTAWSCVEATAPRGHLLASIPPATPASRAIGDSAVIDMLGCGGQALTTAGEPRNALAGLLPDDHASLAERLLAAVHPALQHRVGLDARRVVAEQAAPLVTLAMQAADGRGGFVGRGVYRPPVALFENALLEQAPR